jgi:uncharacterized protein (DUF1810 family)
MLDVGSLRAGIRNASLMWFVASEHSDYRSLKVSGPSNEIFAIRFSGIDWSCYRADSLGRFVAQRASL